MVVIVVTVGAMDVVCRCHGGGFATLLALQVATFQTTGVEAAHGEASLPLALQFDQGLEGGFVQPFLGDLGGREQVLEDPVRAQASLDLGRVAAAIQVGLEGVEGLQDLVLGHVDADLGVNVGFGDFDGLGIADGLEQVAAANGALGVVLAVLAIGLPVHLLGIHVLAGHMLGELLAVVVELQADHGTGHLEGGRVQQGVQHGGVQAGQGIALGGLFEILLDGGLQGLKVFVGTHVLGKLVVNDGHFLGAQILDVDVVGEGFPRQDGVGVVRGMGQGEGLLLVHLQAHQLGVEGPFLVDFQHLVLVGLGLQSLGLHADIAGGDQALGHNIVLHRQELGGALPEAFEVFEERRLIDDPLLLGENHGLVVRQGHFGRHVELGSEDGVSALLQIQLLQRGVGDGQGAGLLGGLPEMLFDELLGHIRLDFASVFLHEDRAWSLAGTEAGDAHLRGDLRHHFAEEGTHLGGGHRHLDGLAGGGLVVEGGRHGGS